MRKLLLASAATLSATLAMSGGAKAQPVLPPAAGTMVIHLNGNFTFQLAGVDAANNKASSGVGAVKYNTFSDVGFLRLYPGFDGMTVSGLQYGVFAELRDTTGLPNGAGVNAVAAPGASPGTTAGSSANGTVNLYIRRAYGYIGTAEDGFVRFGQGDGAFTLLGYGNIEAFGDSQQWDVTNDGLGAITPAGKPNNLFNKSGSLYTTNKIVYLSPSFDGVNFGVSFEPNSNGLQEGSSGFSQEIAIPAGSTNRRRNTIDAMVGYKTTLGPVGVKVSGGYLASSPLSNTTATTAQRGMGIAQFGTEVKYAGATLGANLITGAINDGFSFKTVGQRNDVDLLFSGVYTIGPINVGASYFFNQSAGAHGVTATTKIIARTETNNGIAVGANYSFTPNFNIFAQYLYGSIHQPGATYKNNAGNVISAGNVHTQALGVGATLKW